MEDKVLEALKAYEGSEQEKLDIARWEHIDKLNKRNIKKICLMSIDERKEFINKCIKKYNSKEYKDKEYYKCHCEPRCPLYYVILDYAREYCRPSLYNMNEYFPEEQYDIDGNFVISIIYGQGSIITITPIGENTVIPHIIEDDEMSIYDNNDNLIIKTNNILILNDIRIQIKNKKLDGFYFIHNRVRYEINNKGRIMSPENGNPFNDNNIIQTLEILKR